MTDEIDDEKEAKIVSLRPGSPESRAYERTMISNSRRYNQHACPHKGPYVFDRKLATVGQLCS